MSITYTPNNTAAYPATYAIPEASDLVDIGAAMAPVESLADNVGRLSRPARENTRSYELASRDLQRTCQNFAYRVPADWLLDVSGRSETTVSTATRILFFFDLPHGASLTTISVWVDGAAGHAVGEPAVPWGGDLYSIDLTTGVVTSQGAFDTPGPQGSLADGLFAVERLGISYGHDATKNRIVASIFSESGTGSIAGAKVLGATYTFTTTAQDPGAA